MTKRVLITGINGFAGHYMRQELANAGYEVWGLSNATSGDETSGTLTADLCEASAVRAVIDRVRPTHIVHLAAISFVAHGDIAEIYQTNVVGTRNLLEAAASLQQAPEAVLLVSSANVYGNSEQRILTEDAPINPVNDYAVSKIAMEYMARQFASRLNLVIARPFNYTGRGQSARFLVAKIVEHFRELAPFIELGNLDVARDFSDVRTVVAAFSALIETPAAVGGVFNICSGVAVSLEEILELCCQLTGHRPEVRINPAFVRANEVKSLTGSADRLHSVIGPLRAHTMQDTLAWMLQSN